MSSTNSSQSSVTDLFTMPFTPDLWAHGIASSERKILSQTNPVVPFGNDGWSLAPELHVPDIKSPRRPIQPHEQVYPLQVENFMGVDCAYPRYDLPPKMVGIQTTQMKWEASAYESSLGVSEKHPTGNVWDMLVGLLGTQQGKNFTSTAEKLPMFPSDEKQYFSNDLTGSSPQYLSNVVTRSHDLGLKSCTAANMAISGGHQKSFGICEGCVQVTEKEKNLAMNITNQVTLRHQFSVSSDEWQYEPLHQEAVKNSPLHIPECLVLVGKNLKVDLKNEVTVSNKINEIASKGADIVHVEIHKEDKTSSETSVVSKQLVKDSAPSMLMTKLIQKPSSKSGTSRSKRKGLMTKQKAKLGKKKTKSGKINFKVKKLSLPECSLVSELSEAVAKDKPQESLSHNPHASYVQSIENEQLAKDSAMQVSKTKDSASVNRITTFTTPSCNESQSAFMWTDTSKFLNPLSHCQRLHSVLVNSQKYESIISNTMVIELNLQPSPSLEKKLSINNGLNTSVLGQTGGFSHNPHFTGLLTSAWVPALPNAISKSTQSKMLQITDLWGDEDATDLAETFTNISSTSEGRTLQEAGTLPFYKVGKFPVGQVDFAGVVSRDELLKSQEGWNVQNPAQVCLSRPQEDSSWVAATDNLPSEQQLNLLLHARQCQLLKCAMASCTETKRLLKHCSCCKEVSCPITCCSISRNLLKHWDTCKVFHCPLCASVEHFHGHVKFSMQGTSAAKTHFLDYKKAVTYAPCIGSNSGMSVANPTTTNATNGSSSMVTSRHSEENSEATPSPGTEIKSEREFFPGGKINMANSVQSNLQESRCHNPDAHGTCSHRSQTEWEFPLAVNDLGENLNHISWCCNLGQDSNQQMANGSSSRNTEGPKLAAGFTMSAQLLRERLDCLLHGVACEEPDKTSVECTRKHCSIMKSSVIHMSSCSEFKSCSNVICLLFSPLFMHWKSCYGPCPVCEPINMKYNKKKLMKKFPHEVVENETKPELVCHGSRAIDGRKQGISIAETPYYLRKYMMEGQLSVPAACNCYTAQLVADKKVEGITFSSAGNTWDHLTGIDTNLPRWLGTAPKPDSDYSAGSLKSHTELNGSYSSISGYGRDADPNNCMQDLLSAINMYNYHFLESTSLRMQATAMPRKML